MPRRGIAWKRWMALIVGLWVGLAFSGSYVAVAQAQDDDRSVEVLRRDGQFTILQNGDVEVVETWETRFINGPFRFAFRSIPLNRVEEITNWSVSADGQTYRESQSEQPQTFKLENDGNERKITWYFPAATNETRAFNLSYTLRGALRIYPDGDQFFWKFIEADRAYPINASRVVVRLPANVQPNQLLATTYENTTEAAGGARTVDGQTVEFIGSNFSSGDEWEIRVQFPHGIVPNQPPSWQAADDAQRAAEAMRLANRPFYNLVTLAAALITLIGGGLGLYLLWYRRGRDKPISGVAPYSTTPPDDVPPGLVGTLIDERADMQDIMATLVDLARRGYFQIVEQERSDGRLNSAPKDFTFVRGTGDLRQLRPYEKRLFDRLFGTTIRERKLSSLKNQFHTTVGVLQKELYDETVQLGYFDRNPNTTRNIYTAIGFGLLALGLPLGFGLMLLATYYTPLIVLLIVIYFGLALAFLIMSRFMSRKTEAGSATAAKWRAFKRYLENLDRYTQLETAKDQFDRYLPYAIAFGLERQWVRRFEQVDTPAPMWYQPYYMPIYAGGYASDHDRGGGSRSGDGGSGGGSFNSGGLNQGASQTFGGLNAMSAGLFTMLNSASTTFTSTPAPSGGSSGGFSGGGFSGGGGGGGSSGFG